MAKKQQVFFVFLALFAINVAAYSWQFKGNMKHPDLPNHCYYGDYNITIPVNETAYPKNLKDACITVFCREDFVLQIKHCQSKGNDCTWGPPDYSKPYPDCCPPLICPDKQ